MILINICMTHYPRFKGRQVSTAAPTADSQIILHLSSHLISIHFSNSFFYATMRILAVLQSSSGYTKRGKCSCLVVFLCTVVGGGSALTADSQITYKPLLQHSPAITCHPVTSNSCTLSPVRRYYRWKEGLEYAKKG